MDSIEFEQEDDGRWIAELPQLPGVMAYGASRDEARRNVEVLAQQAIAEKLKNEGSKSAGNFFIGHDVEQDLLDILDEPTA